MQVATEVNQRHPRQFDMCGQALTQTLFQTDESISPGLAKRIFSYAERELDGAGMLAAVKGWTTTVGTNDGDEKPADRSYWVSWTNSAGTSISLVGILTYKGWPSLDHGLQISR